MKIKEPCSPAPWALESGCPWQGAASPKRSLRPWGISAEPGEVMQGLGGTSGQMLPLRQPWVMHREEQSPTQLCGFFIQQIRWW